MDQPDSVPRRLRFGAFVADLRTGELTKQGKRLHLQEQPFRLLAMLLERAGELVTREEVRQRLWPRAVVDFDHGLSKAVSKIRDVLGDSAEKPRFIETVARRGYRFLADVQTLPETDARPRELQPQGTEQDSVHGDVLTAHNTGRRAPWPHRRIALAIACGALLALLAMAWMVYWPHRSFAAIHSLAVLPLANFSNDASQEYFADGMTDELITQLGQIRSLRIISRTSAMSYKNTRKPLATIARELDVQAVVEGSVLRDGDRVRITAQLIRVPADEHLWAHSYEGSFRDTLALQSEVSQAIAAQIRATLSSQEKAALSTSKVVDADAYEAYLKGRYFWNKRDAAGLKKAIDYFQRAIAVDPGYAPAYAGLADAYSLAGAWEYGVLPTQEAYPRAREAATKAVLLDPMLAEAHTSLAFSLDQYPWDWGKAEQEFRRALDLNPGYATAHHWYGYHLMTMGRSDEGIAELKRAQSLDPLSLIIGAGFADVLYIAHRFDEAQRELQKTLEMDPDFAVAHHQKGQVLVQQRSPEAAIGEFQRAIELSGHSGAFDADLAYAYAVSGHADEARMIVGRLEQQKEESGSTDANIALVYVGLNDADQAMRWLEKAYAARFGPGILIRPPFDPLRNDPRFKDLIRRLGLGT